MLSGSIRNPAPMEGCVSEKGRATQSNLMSMGSASLGRSGRSEAAEIAASIDVSTAP